MQGTLGAVAEFGVLDLAKQALGTLEAGRTGDFEARVLASWRVAGRPLVEDYWNELQALTAPIDDAIATGRSGAAAAMLQVAAHHAVLWHPGLFTSLTMERRLWALGRKALRFPGEATKPGPGSLAICHVLTEASEIGGHSRNVWRWIGNDADNRHSVALTRQSFLAS